MAETVTNRGKKRWLDSSTTSTLLDIRCTLFTGTQTGANNPDLNTVADLDAVSGISIHSQRITLTGETVTQDNTNDRAAYDSSDVSFTASPGTTAQGFIIYDEGGGTDATRDLLAIYTTGFPQPVDGGLNVTITDLIRAT